MPSSESVKDLSTQDNEQSKLAKLDKMLYKWFTAMHNLKRLNIFMNEMQRTN